MPRFSSDMYVPPVDSADNVETRDVIGNKSDTHAGNSLVAFAERLDEHIHSVSGVYPTLADGITLTAAAGAWTLGTLVEVIPANTITEDFDIHAIDVESLQSDGVYEIVIYYGAGDTEVARIRVVRTSVTNAVLNTPVQTPIIPANSRVRAAVASAAGSQTASISLRYHTY